MLEFLAAEGGAAVWFRARLGRVLLGFLAAEGGAAVWLGAALRRVLLGLKIKKCPTLITLYIYYTGGSLKREADGPKN